MPQGFFQGNQGKGTMGRQAADKCGIQSVGTRECPIPALAAAKIKPIHLAKDQLGANAFPRQLLEGKTMPHFLEGRQHFRTPQTNAGGNSADGNDSNDHGANAGGNDKAMTDSLNDIEFE